MPRVNRARFLLALLAGTALASTPALLHAGEPVGTAFTYQGHLKHNGAPLDEPADFQFTLWDAETGGSQIGAMVPIYWQTVADGLFTVALDFGDSPFAGDARWLEIAVRVPAMSGGDFTTLAARQRLAPTPYAIHAQTAENVAGGLAGSGTPDFLPLFIDATTLGSSGICQVNGKLGIGTMTPTARLEILHADDGPALHVEATATTGIALSAKGGEDGLAASFRGNVRIQSHATGDTVVEIGEGLDYAEGFDVSAPARLEPGTVLIIDPDQPGKLTISSRPYDSKVAGIVAGANGLGSGVRLGAGQFDYPVALAGRVYCQVDATEIGVEPGDLLTTSATPGHAMKATDPDRARGAILGKAMQKLERGQKGRILVLVSLQ